MIVRRLDQRLGVLRKAGAAVAWSRMQEFGPDALVEADPARHVLDIGPDPLAKIGDLVDEGYFRGEKSVGRVFGQFRRAAAGKKEGCLVEIQRPVDFRHDRFGAFVLDADDDAVRALEIVDRRAFAQKFRVGYNREFGIRPGLANDPLDFVAGADGDRGFCHDHRKPIEPRGDRTRGIVDEGKIGMAVAAPRRRSDRNEDRLRSRDRRSKIGRKGKSALPHVVSDEIVQAGFEDRHFPRLQGFDFLPVAVNTNDRMSEIRKTRSRHEPHVARTDHCNVHLSPLERLPYT